MARATTSINEPTWVYHVYCEHNGLLYVGVARNVEARIRQHRKSKPWWHREVDQVLATLYPTRQQALEVEAHAIRTFRPVYNIAGQASTEPLPHERQPHPYQTIRFHDARGKTG